MRRTAAVILALALLTACGQSTRQQWQIVPQIYVNTAAEETGKKVTLSAELPQGWEAELFRQEDGTQRLALKEEKGELGTVTVYRDDGDTYGRLTEDHMLWLFLEDLHEAVCTAAEKCSYADFEYLSKNREYAEPKTRGYSMRLYQLQFDGWVVSAEMNLYEDDENAAANCENFISGLECE